MGQSAFHGSFCRDLGCTTGKAGINKLFGSGHFASVKEGRAGGKFFVGFFMFKAFVLYIFRNESCCAIFNFRTDIFVLKDTRSVLKATRLKFSKKVLARLSMYNMPSQLSGFSISNRDGRWTRTKEFIDTRLNLKCKCTN